MAEESVFAPRRKIHDRIERSDITLTPTQAKQLGKRAGKYITVFSSAVMTGEQDLYERLSSALSDAIKEVLPKNGKTLVVGLGNAFMTADALGVETASNLEPSEKLLVVTPSVYGRTGIESYTLVKALCKEVLPSAVLCVDTLCSATKERLGCAFQVSNSGITPGSGVGNARKTLCSETLSIPVISVGLPLVIYASTLSGEGEEDLVVTPKDIDLIVKESAFIIARAIEKSVGTPPRASVAK